MPHEQLHIGNVAKATDNVMLTLQLFFTSPCAIQYLSRPRYGAYYVAMTEYGRLPFNSTYIELGGQSVTRAHVATYRDVRCDDSMSACVHTNPLSGRCLRSIQWYSTDRIAAKLAHLRFCHIQHIWDNVGRCTTQHAMAALQEAPSHQDGTRLLVFRSSPQFRHRHALKRCWRVRSTWPPWEARSVV